MTSSFGPPTSSWTTPPRKSRTLHEKRIEKAIMQAFLLKHSIRLEKTNAGGASDKKGVMRCPKAILAPLGIPTLPWGMEAWLGLPPGYPDLTAALPNGRFLFIEVKAPGGSFRPGQKEFLLARVAEGHIAFWTDNVNQALETFEAAMRRAVS